MPAAGDQQLEPAFTIAVIAALSGHDQEHQPPLRERRPVLLDLDNFNDSMRGSAPSLSFAVSNRLAPDDSDLMMRVDLRFEAIDDFRPERIARQVPAMAEMLQVRQQIEPWLLRLQYRPDDVSELTAPGRVAPQLAPWLAQLDADKQPDVHSALERMVAGIDFRLSRQLECILHHPEFQRLEATWRGLHYLAREVESSDLLQVLLVNASAAELARDFRRSISFDESVLFKRLYDTDGKLYGRHGVSLMVADMAADQSNECLDLLQHLAQVASACCAPMLVGASPALFSLGSWQELPRPRDLSRIFDTVDYAGWRRLRASEDASHLAVVMPPVLARAPWDTRDALAEHGMAFVERAEQEHEHLWMNGAYAMAALIAGAQARDGWCADLRGPVWGRIDGLPAHVFDQADEGLTVIGPVAVQVSDGRHRELHALGFASIAQHAQGSFAAMPAPRVLGATLPSRQASTPGAWADRYHLEQVLCVNRFAQAVRCFVKDHAGQWPDLELAAAALQAWLDGFCGGPVDEADGASTATSPLVSAKVDARANGSLQVLLVIQYVPTRQQTQVHVILQVPAEWLAWLP